MSTDEQQSLSDTGQYIKEKINTRNSCQQDVDALVDQLEKIINLYKENKRNTDELSAHLMQLPQDDKIVRTFRKLLDADNALACIQQKLGLTVTETQ